MSEAQTQAVGTLQHEYDILIKEQNLDTFGHVNNAAYLVLFEEARWDILEKSGFGLNEIAKRKMGPTILDIHIQFKREVKNRDRIKIRSSVLSHKGKITVIRQIMINEKGEEACIADLTFGLFDVAARKLIEPTPEWKRALGLP